VRDTAPNSRTGSCLCVFSSFLFLIFSHFSTFSRCLWRFEDARLKHFSPSTVGGKWLIIILAPFRIQSALRVTQSPDRTLDPPCIRTRGIRTAHKVCIFMKLCHVAASLSGNLTCNSIISPFRLPGGTEIAFPPPPLSRERRELCASFSRCTNEHEGFCSSIFPAALDALVKNNVGIRFSLLEFTADRKDEKGGSVYFSFEKEEPRVGANIHV